MITRSNLADQLREYQFRSKHDWTAASFFSSSSSSPSSVSYTSHSSSDPRFRGDQRVLIGVEIDSSLSGGDSCGILFCFGGGIWASVVDAVVFVIWELVILAFLVFSAVSLYFRHIRLAFTLVSFMLLLFVCMKITNRIRSARKRKRRMLLPLSM